MQVEFVNLDNKIAQLGDLINQLRKEQENNFKNNSKGTY